MVRHAADLWPNVDRRPLVQDLAPTFFTEEYLENATSDRRFGPSRMVFWSVVRTPPTVGSAVFW